jgi:hypothetical protein
VGGGRWAVGGGAEGDEGDEGDKGGAGYLNTWPA